MQLLAVTLRHYRLHRELAVEFDPRRTLIGGPNESGKSTLVEAIHRAFFLRAKSTGDVHQGMVSRNDPRAPEVEVRFRTNDRTYTLKKVFDGAKGSALLEEEGGATFKNDEAETELSRLLDGEKPESGRGAAERIRGRWGHLWVWQGDAGGDPATRVGSASEQLIRRLQEAGGAGAFQSDLDASLADKAAAERNERLTAGANPRPKAHSVLKKSEDALEAARETCREAEAFLEATLLHADHFRSAETDIARHEQSRRELEEQRTALAANSREVERLQGLRKERESEWKTLSETRDEAEGAEKRIAELREKETGVARELEPLERQAADLAERRKTLKNDRQALQSEFDREENRLRLFRRQREIMRLHEEIARLEREEAGLARTIADIDTLEKEMAGLKRESDTLAPLSPSDLERLRGLEQAVGVARSRLEATAAGLEVCEADQAILIDGERVRPGESRDLTRTADIRVGDHVLLRLSPGGGTSLEEARQSLAATEETLRETLVRYGVRTLDDAREIVSRREALRGRMEKAGARHKALQPQANRKRTEELRSRIAEKKRQAELLETPDSEESPERPAETADSAQLEEEIRRLEDGQGERRGKLAALAEEIEAVEERRTKLEERRRGREDERKDALTRLGLLEERHGNKEAREKMLSGVRERLRELDTDREQLNRKLAALRAEDLEADLKRVERALTRAGENLVGAREARAAARAHLRSEGGRDPESEVKLARAELRRAEETYQREKRHTEAIDLLYRTFQDARAALADRFSRPLADRIDRYLKALFGPEVEARVEFTDNRLAGIEMVRHASGGAYPFGALSGGTREQVAAAARLAVAELLAEDFGGCLPVVFDDAFAYSDPQRVGELPRMLELAAEGGLQVIVLTCHPADYASFGAREIRLA